MAFLTVYLKIHFHIRGEVCVCVCVCVVEGGGGGWGGSLGASITHYFVNESQALPYLSQCCILCYKALRGWKQDLQVQCKNIFILP